MVLPVKEGASDIAIVIMTIGGAIGQWKSVGGNCLVCNNGLICLNVVGGANQIESRTVGSGMITEERSLPTYADGSSPN